MAQLKSWLLKS
uniref:Uncharacterized protein n=1 Tax=Arundo donax TaxID=35708 RepID=A0A0A9TTX5_ARUDO